MEQIVPFSAWTSESELLPYIAPFLHAPDGEELQVRMDDGDRWK
jgi:hypothetical protein